MQAFIEGACHLLAVDQSISTRATALTQYARAPRDSDDPVAIHWAAAGIFNALHNEDFPVLFPFVSSPPPIQSERPSVQLIYDALYKTAPKQRRASAREVAPAFFECAASLAFDVNAAGEVARSPRYARGGRGGAVRRDFEPGNGFSRRRKPHKSVAGETLQRMKTAWEVSRVVLLRADAEKVFGWMASRELPGKTTSRGEIWALFVAVKSALSQRCPDARFCPGQDRVSGWNLLIATLVVWHGVDKENNMATGQAASMCAKAKASVEKVTLFVSEIKSIMPSNILKFLPAANLDTSARERLEALLHQWYHTMNKVLSPATVMDERPLVLKSTGPALLFVPRVGSPSKPEPVEDDIRSRYPAGMATSVLPRQRVNPESTANDSSQFETPEKPRTSFAATCSPLDALAAAAASQTPPRLKVVPSGNRPMSLAPETPFSGSINCVQWLESLAESRSEVSDLGVPSEGLARFIEAGSEVWSSVLTSAYNLSEEAFRPCTDHNLTDHEIGVLAIRQREAVAVYFSAVEGILVTEQRRLHRSNFDKLVKSPKFQKSVMACAVEATSTAYGKVSNLPFPNILEAYDLQPFEMSKVIRTFIGTVPGLPRPVSRHLAFCQERILESLAWQGGSPLVAALQDRQEVLAAVDSNTSKSDIALSFFFRDMMSMASARVVDLTQRLGFSRESRVAVWEFLKFVISERWEFLVDRHLDQLLVCCVYGVDKMSRLSGQRRNIPLKFKDIIQSYRVLPHVCSPSFSRLMPGVYRAVRMNDSGVWRGDVIQFYNRVFIMDDGIKNFLLNLKASRNAPQFDAMGVSKPLNLPQTQSRDVIKSQIADSPLKAHRSNAQLVIPVGTARLMVSPMSPWNRRPVFDRAHGTPVSAHNIRRSPAKAAYEVTPNTKLLLAFGETKGLYTQVSIGADVSADAGSGIPPEFLSPSPRTPKRRLPSPPMTPKRRRGGESPCMITLEKANEKRKLDCGESPAVNDGTQDESLMRKYGKHGDRLPSTPSEGSPVAVEVTDAPSRMEVVSSPSTSVKLGPSDQWPGLSRRSD